MINEISALFVMIFTAGLMFVMPMLDMECNDIIIIIGFGIILSFMLTIIPILLSYDIREIVVDTSVYKTDLPYELPRAGGMLFSFNILIYQIY